MNKFIVKTVTFGLLVTIAGGCSTVQKIQNLSASNANTEDKTRNALGLKKTGIPECDEVIEILSKKSKENANVAEESWADRAKAEFIKQQIYNYINNGNANKTPKEKAELAEKCKTALGYLR